MRPTSKVKRAKRAKRAMKDLAARKGGAVKGGYGTGVYKGGVRVAVGDVNGDGANVITGAAAGGGPHVKVFDGSTGAGP